MYKLLLELNLGSRKSLKQFLRVIINLMSEKSPAVSWYFFLLLNVGSLELFSK